MRLMIFAIARDFGDGRCSRAIRRELPEWAPVSAAASADHAADAAGALLAEITNTSVSLVVSHGTGFIGVCIGCSAHAAFAG